MKYNGKVKVMGWSGETSMYLVFALFFAACNIYVQIKEESFDNPFISMYAFILALQDYSLKYVICLLQIQIKQFQQKQQFTKYVLPASL